MQDDFERFQMSLWNWSNAPFISFYQITERVEQLYLTHSIALVPFEVCGMGK